MEQRLSAMAQEMYGKKLDDCSNEEIYIVLMEAVKEEAKAREKHEGKKKLYYISAEFLIGKLLSNNLINLKLYDEVKAVLALHGKVLTEIEEVELEPSLGNGGLGRLAACFLDSIATLGLNGDGVGLNYHFGLFRQKFEDHSQRELANPWLTEKSWLTKTDVSYPIKAGGMTLISRMYDIDVTGYENRTNKLHLFDIETVDEDLVKEGIDFDETDIARNLTLFLYPNDASEEGQLLRIYQQYFMVSNAARLIIDECEQRGSSLHDLYEYAAIQINDTHPTMVIPEMIRLLTERGIEMDEAIEIMEKTCAYTNHTILSEALEKWPVRYLKKVVPQLMPIIEVMDDKVRRKYEDPSVYIIKKAGNGGEELVHMAHLDIHYCHSVNGVAALHTEILEKKELNNFYNIYPEKFNNKTNGITFRRWLMHCNHPLSEYIGKCIGEGYKKDAMELEKLSKYENDEAVLTKLLEMKEQCKKNLADYLKQTQGLTLNPNGIFDIQVKRLHAYKRQQMNALYVISKYLEIKSGKIPSTPINIIFGAKAAPAYLIAKDIIHLILCLQELIQNDEEVNPYLNVIMTENYNVTLAEKLIPACDISEQISLASKEASGTGNMKFMLNGAITLGTMDGANVEIAELVGEENCYIFGESSEAVIDLYERKNARLPGAYNPNEIYSTNPEIKKLVDFIIGEELLKIGNEENLTRLHHDLVNEDYFMTLLDLEAYKAKKEEIYADYEDRKSWAKKMLVNISKAGYFSSDRTIQQYEDDIWHLTDMAK